MFERKGLIAAAATVLTVIANPAAAQPVTAVGNTITGNSDLYQVTADPTAPDYGYVKSLTTITAGGVFPLSGGTIAGISFDHAGNLWAVGNTITGNSDLFRVAADPTASDYGYVKSLTTITAGGVFPLNGTIADISFGPDPAAAVPEPAAWAMMVFGFGVIGVGLRRRTTLGSSFRPMPPKSLEASLRSMATL